MGFFLLTCVIFEITAKIMKSTAAKRENPPFNINHSHSDKHNTQSEIYSLLLPIPAASAAGIRPVLLLLLLLIV